MDPTTGKIAKNLRSGKPRITPEPDAYYREQVKILASKGRTHEETAVVLHISLNTLYRCYQSEFEEGRSQLSRSIRKKQVELALGGHSWMLIWLGKQYLEQCELNRDEGLPPDCGYGFGGESVPISSEPPTITIVRTNGRAPNVDKTVRPAATEPAFDNQPCRRRSWSS